MDLFRRLALSLLALAAPLAARAQSTVPTLTQALPTQTLSIGGAAVTIDLKNYFSLPGVTGQIVQFDTVLGKFNVELFGNDAPRNVANFLSYVNSGAYTNTFFHRSEPGFVVQGGGYKAVTTLDTIPRPTTAPLEYKVPNTRGTLAMARTSDPNSASAEWFINLVDNTTLLAPGGSSTDGYTAFGRVLGTGMTVADAIGALPRISVSNDPSSPFTTIPVINFDGTNASVANLVVVNSVTTVPLYSPTGTDPGVLAFNAFNNNGAVVGVALSGPALTITPLTAAGTATISIRAADTNGSVASSTINITVAAANSAPAITTQPVSQNVATGSTAVFNVAVTGVPTPTYQWQFNGADLNGATGSRLVLPGGTAAAGTYRVVIKNSIGSVTSVNAALSFTTTTDVGHLSNLSVLTDLTAADPSFTLGTVIGGGAAGATKPVVIRAVGPSLTAFNYAAADVVSDPTLQVFSGQTVVAENDNWNGDATLASAFTRVGAFQFANGTSKDSAVYNATMPARDYTVTVKGVGGATGKVLAEIYDASGGVTPGTPRLLDVSVLKNIAAGSSVTAGFVIGGSTSRTVLVRAIGPGLAALNITSGTLGDPFIELFDGASKKILDNDNWGGDAQITAANNRVGAFAIADLASKDAILLVTLTPGNYTARVSGVGSAAGLAVVEVYDVP